MPRAHPVYGGGLFFVHMDVFSLAIYHYINMKMVLFCGSAGTSSQTSALLLDIYPLVELLEHTGIPFLVYRGAFTLFLPRLDYLTLPPVVCEGPFHLILASCVVFCLFVNGLSNWSEMLSSQGFHLHFPDE